MFRTCGDDGYGSLTNPPSPLSPPSSALSPHSTLIPRPVLLAAALPSDAGMHDLQASCQVTAFARDSRGDGHAYAWQLLGTSHGSTLRPLAIEVPA